MAKRIGVLLLLSAVFAHSATSQTKVQGKAVAYSKPVITQFGLYAERSIRIKEHGRVEPGDIGVRSAATAKQGASQLQVGRHAKGGNLYAASTTLGNDAEVKNVWTNSLKRDPNSEMGAENAFPAADMPPLPLISASGNGPDVKVGHDEHQSLAPGIYGAITLAHNSELSLTAGKYIFASLRMEEDSKLFAEKGTVDVRIIAGLWMGKEAKLATRSDDAKAESFSISVAGDDPTEVSQETRLAPTTAVSIGKKVQIHGLLAAPHGTVWIADEAKIKGAVVGFDIILEENVRVELESGFPASQPGQQGSQQLQGYFGLSPNPAVAALVGPVPTSTVVELAIGLPVRNPAGLRNFVNQVSNPTDPNYRKYLTLAQFTATYGATPADYQSVVNWAQSHGLHVTATYPNNLLVDLSGTATQVEEALYANLVYRLRQDGSLFVAVDREPSLDLSTPILHISGIDSYVATKTFGGTSPVGDFWGWDFQNAYLGIGTSCSGLTGAGQTIGIVSVGDFLQSDITAYDTTAGAPTAQNTTALPLITPTKVGSASLGDNGGKSQIEVTLDIETAQSMAPGATIIVFEGSTGSSDHADSILHKMATNTPPLTIGSSSVGFGWNPNGEQALTEMAAQGVSYFQASGDSGGIKDPTDNRDFTYETLVGGTTLTTAFVSPGPPLSYTNPYYLSEATWPSSGGSIMNGGTQQCWPWPFCQSASTGIPGYQVGVDMSTNGGSTAFRNSPDVSMDTTMTEIVNGAPADRIGTSIATPLWAGFMALANQQATLNGVGIVGFANPVIYAIGLTGSASSSTPYSLSFNDITDGVSNGLFSSVTGYDLATGWGTPKCGLITQLASPAPLNPQTFQLIQIHISNGGDGIADGSTGLVAVYLSGALQPIILDEFHPQNSTGWDPTGVVHDLILSFPAKVPANSIGSILFSLPCCDDWSIGGLDVRLFNPNGAEGCVFHGESAKNPDGTVKTELARLTHNNNPLATFTPGGCPAGSGTPPPASPVSEVIFILDTGDDDLRSGSELDVSFFKPGSAMPFETGILKQAHSPNKFDNSTQNTVTYPLTTGPHPLSDFGSISISLNHSGNDEWHIYGINVVADSPGGPQSCLYDASGQPLQVLNSGTMSMTLNPNTGCP
jgi:hypothetical protein